MVAILKSLGGRCLSQRIRGVGHVEVVGAAHSSVFEESTRMAPLGAPEAALGHAHAAIGIWTSLRFINPDTLLVLYRLILIGADEVLADNNV